MKSTLRIFVLYVLALSQFLYSPTSLAKSQIDAPRNGSWTTYTSEAIEISPVTKDLNAKLIGATGADIVREEKTYEKFYIGLGYEDISQKIRDNQKARNLKGIPAQVSEDNAERYELINLTREISMYVMARIAVQIKGSDEKRARDAKTKSLQLAQRWMTLAPLEIPGEFFTQVGRMKEGPAKDEAKSAYAARLAQQNILAAKNQMMEEVLTTIYGRDALEKVFAMKTNAPEKVAFMRERDELELKFSRFIKRFYEDPDMQTTKWLGRGIVWGLTRLSREIRTSSNPHKDLEKLLTEALSQAGENIFNYISNEQNFVDKNGKSLRFVVESGDVALEMSKEGKDSYQLSAATRPKSIKNYFRAFVKGIYTYMSLYPLVEDKEASGKQLARDKAPGFWDRLKHHFSQTEVAQMGWSHAGIFKVYEGEFGIKNVQVRDMYPNFALGGQRRIGLEGFSHDGRYAKLGFVKWDFEKLQQLGRIQFEDGSKELAEDGREIFYTSQKATLNKEEMKANILNEKDQWKLTKEQMAIHKKLVMGSKEQFKRQAREHIMAATDAYLYGHRPLGFAYAFKDGSDMAWCSLFVWLAYREGLGINPQSSGERWHVGVLAMKALGSKDTKDVDSNKVAISPNSFAWDDYLVKNSSYFGEDGYVSISYPSRNVVESQLKLFSARRVPMNKEVDRLLVPTMKISFIKEDLEVVTGQYESYIDASLSYRGFGTVSESESFSKFISLGKGEKKTTNADPDLNNDKYKVTGSGLDWMERQNIQTEMNEFLGEMGYYDHAKITEEYIKQGRTYNVMTATQQKDNLKTYRALNSARNLAVSFMASVKNRLDKEKDIDMVAEFVAQMLALQPKNPPLQEQQEILGMSEKSAKEAVRKAHTQRQKLVSILKRNIDATTREVIADMMSVLYGDNVSKAMTISDDMTEAQKKTATQLQGYSKDVYRSLAPVIERMYMDSQMGGTKWFGRALALLLAREAELKSNGKSYLEHKIMKTLAKKLEDHGLMLEYFIGSQIASVDANNRKRIVPVDTGDYILFRTRDFETGVIANGAIPGDTERAEKLNVLPRHSTLGFASGALFGGSSVEDLKHGLSNTSRFYEQLSQEKIDINEGYSHIGFISVHKGKKVQTQITHTLIIDAYPRAVAGITSDLSHPGGVRFNGAGPEENYLVNSHIERFMVAKINHKRFGAEMKKQLAANLKDKGDIVFESYKIILDDEKQPKYPNETTKGGWKALGDKQEILQAARKDDAEFARWLLARADAHSYTMAHEGVIFMWIAPRGAYYEGATYCSQFRWLAFTVVNNGLDIEPVRTKMHPVVDLAYGIGKVAEFLHSKNLLPESLRSAIVDSDPIQSATINKTLPRLIAPANLVIQNFVNDSDITQIQYRKSSLSERAKEDYNDSVVRNPEVLFALNKSLVNAGRAMQYEGLVEEDILEAIEKISYFREIVFADAGVRSTELQTKRIQQIQAQVKTLRSRLGQ